MHALGCDLFQNKTIVMCFAQGVDVQLRRVQYRNLPPAPEGRTRSIYEKLLLSIGETLENAVSNVARVGKVAGTILSRLGRWIQSQIDKGAEQLQSNVAHEHSDLLCTQTLTQVVASLAVAVVVIVTAKRMGLLRITHI